MKKKQVKQLLTALAVAAAATIISSFSTQYLTFLSSLENVAGDIRIAALQPPQPQSKDIVIAAINEDTLAQFPYRSPVDRQFIANTLQTLEKKGARMIGVDILFDQPTEEAKDAALKKTLSEMKVPTFVSYSNTPGIVNDEQLAYLNAMVPENMRAGANLATDPFDSSVRWIYPGQDAKGMPLGFVRKAAELAGIPTPNKLVEIAWKPRVDMETPPFPIYPAHALAVLPNEWFAGKIVLVGAVLSITDRHRTPLAVVSDEDGNMPGIEVQAHGIAQFLEGRKPLRLGIEWTIGVSLLLALIGMGIGLLKKGIAFNVVGGIVVLILFWATGMLGFRYVGVPLIPLVAPTLSLALSLWMMDVLIGSAERKQRQFVQGAFSRYVSPAVVGQLVENPESLSISGTRKDVTFIFTDIAGFTTLSEKLTSEKLSEVLNAYLDGACEIILRHEGTIDKFIGDAIMSIFNAPIPQTEHAARAVRCALELDAYAEAFRIKANAEGVPIGVTRIGLHSGPAVVGNFGSHSRMDFTALGDTVNTAARTEGVNKYFGTRICATEEVVGQCKDLPFRPVGDVVLKGKLTAVGLFNPVTEEHAHSEQYRRYMEMYQLLKAEDPAASEAVRQFHQDYPEDPLGEFHFERVEKGLNTALVVMEDK